MSARAAPPSPWPDGLPRPQRDSGAGPTHLTSVAPYRCRGGLSCGVPAPRKGSGCGPGGSVVRRLRPRALRPALGFVARGLCTHFRFVVLLSYPGQHYVCVRTCVLPYRSSCL